MKTLLFLILAFVTAGFFVVGQVQPNGVAQQQAISPSLTEAPTVPAVTGYAGHTWVADQVTSSVVTDKVIAVSQYDVSMQGTQTITVVSLPVGHESYQDIQSLPTTDPGAVPAVGVLTGSRGSPSNLPVLQMAGWTLLGFAGRMVLKKNKHRHPWIHFTGTTYPSTGTS